MQTKLFRFFAALALLAGLALSPLTQIVHADGTIPTIEIVRVVSGTSVTIRTHDFPGYQLFTVRMGKFGTQGVNGTVVDVTNSGAGGSFDVTYAIPSGLKSEENIAIRLESPAGFFAYNWFANQSNSGGGAPTSTPAPSTSGKPMISILSVVKDTSIVVRAQRFPANTTFTIRVGTYFNFFKDYVVMGSINSGNGGTFDFNVNLPNVVKGVELVSVRLDGNGQYAFNAFTNVSGGTTGGTAVTPTVTPLPSSNNACQIVSVSPTGTMAPYADFDAVWEVKNISSKAWDKTAVDYKYVSGAQLQKKASAYDLQQTVNAGSTFKIIVDMKAPAQKASYTTYWSLVQGGTTLCSLGVTVTVK